MSQNELVARIENSYTKLIFQKNLDSKKQYLIFETVDEVCTGNYIQFYRNEAVKREIGLYRLITDSPLETTKEIKIPSGLVWAVLEKLEDKIVFEIHDDRKIETDMPQFYEFKYELDEKQKEAIQLGLELRRGYFKAATGSGKTSIIAGLIGEIGGVSLVIVEGIDLVTQIAQDLRMVLKVPIWEIVGAESLNHCPSGADIAVASVDTLYSNLELIKRVGWLKQFNSIYADEVHHCTFTKEKIKRKDKKIISRIPAGLTAYYHILMESDAYNRFGFTATDEGSELYIRAALGQKIIDINEDYLIQQGRVSKPYVIIYYRKVKFHDDVGTATIQEIYLSEERNLILLNAMRTVNELGGSVLFMLDSKKHQLNLIREWVDWPILTGETKRSYRTEVFDKLRNKEINGIIMTIGKEGINLPNVDCIIRASGRKSIRLVKQEKGRGSRKTEEKDRYIIIDTFEDDGTNRIYDPVKRTWRSKKGYLKRQSQERLDIYNQTKEGEIKMVETLEELEAEIRRVF